MRNHSLALIALLAFTFSASAALADAPSPDSLVVSIPFSFKVGDRTMPAGKYVVGRLSQTASCILVRSSDGGKSAVALTAGSLRGTSDDREPKLVFNRYDGQYFLSQVWIPGRGVAVELAISEEETALARNGTDMKTVALVSTPCWARLLPSRRYEALSGSSGESTIAWNVRRAASATRNTPAPAIALHFSFRLE
jgi:hypothetical protein